MSQFPPLKAPDGFELGVFARMMLSQLPSATAPASFEADIMQSATGSKVPKKPRPLFPRGINWKTTFASLTLLMTLGTVTLFTGVWDMNGLPQGTTETTQTENPSDSPSNPAYSPSTSDGTSSQPAPTDIKKADAEVKTNVIKRGKRAMKNASKVVAGYPTAAYPPAKNPLAKNPPAGNPRAGNLTK